MLILSEFTLTQRRPRRNQRQRTDPTSVECNPQPPAGGNLHPTSQWLSCPPARFTGSRQNRFGVTIESRVSADVINDSCTLYGSRRSVIEYLTRSHESCRELGSD
jgi:hypothetical protein